MTNKPSRALRAAALLITAVMLASCSVYLNDYGRFLRSREVSDAFYEAKVMPGYQYYYMGPDAEPSAIIAIADGYTLDTKLWKAVNLESEILRGWMRMYYRGGPSWTIAGSWILDPAGKKIGMWYSRYNTSTVKVTGKSVTVYAPDTSSSLQMKPFKSSDW